MSVLIGDEAIRELVVDTLEDIVPDHEEVRVSVVPHMVSEECEDCEDSARCTPWVTVHFALDLPEAEAYLTTSWKVRVSEALHDSDQFRHVICETWTNLCARRLLLTMDKALEHVLNEEGSDPPDPS